MDLSKYQITDDDVGVMTVKHPGSGMPLKDSAGAAITITMVGLDSPKHRAALRQLAVRRIKERNAAPELDEAQMVGEIERNGAESVAAAVVSWSGIGIGEDSSPCNTENVLKAFDALPWLKVQCDTFLGQRANFLKASAKDS